MNRANKNFNKIPSGISRGRVFYDNAIEDLSLNKRWSNKPSIVYKSASVRRELAKIYGFKCAFCNQRSKGSSLHVEHFRPKNGIFSKPSHSGYYWLGYEWTNLLFACSTCNTAKGTRFELINESDRIQQPVWSGTVIDQTENKIYSKSLKKEKCTLLNPEIDNPDDHLIYLPDGKFHHLTPRGKYTIKTLKLNRDELYVKGRKELLDNILKKLNRRVNRYLKGERNFKTTMNDVIDIVVEEIIEPIESKKDFDHFLETIFKNYQIYIIARLIEDKKKRIVNWTFLKLNQGITI